MCRPRMPSEPHDLLLAMANTSLPLSLLGLSPTCPNLAPQEVHCADDAEHWCPCTKISKNFLKSPQARSLSAMTLGMLQWWIPTDPSRALGGAISEAGLHDALGKARLEPSTMRTLLAQTRHKGLCVDTDLLD